MGNLGVKELALVQPQCALTHPDVEKMACGAKRVVRKIRDFADLSQAVAASDVVVGTTRRIRYQKNRDYWSPVLLRAWWEKKQTPRLFLVFAPEDTGLSNVELALCQRLVTIETQAQFASLNLSQTVAVLLYELSLSQGRKAQGIKKQERYANSKEMEGFFRHWHEVLAKVSLLDAQNPYRAMNQFREFFNRAEPTSRELALFRALCRKILWVQSKFSAPQ